MEAEELKNAMLIKQRQRPRYRVGKQPMYVSKKFTKIKKEKAKQEDPEKMAFRKYLGQLSDEEEPKKTK